MAVETGQCYIVANAFLLRLLKRVLLFSTEASNYAESKRSILSFFATLQVRTDPSLNRDNAGETSGTFLRMRPKITANGMLIGVKRLPGIPPIFSEHFDDENRFPCRSFYREVSSKRANICAFYFPSTCAYIHLFNPSLTHPFFRSTSTSNF